MRWRWLKSMGFLSEALLAESAPRQVAVAIALGIAVGLIPKGNLLAVGLAILLFALRVNLASGLATAALFTWVGTLLDPSFHLLGRGVLTAPLLQPVFTWCYQLPLVPWTGFNNTVVAGSAIVAAIQAYPTYRLAKPFFERHFPGGFQPAGGESLGGLLVGK